MVKGTLKKPDGTELISFEIPMDLKQVKLSSFVDFLVESRSLDDEDFTNTVLAMTRAVSAFYQVDFQTILQAASGILGTGQESFADSISTLYGHAINLIGNFKPEVLNNHSFEYKGFVYTVPEIVKQALEDEFLLPDLSVVEVVEVAEIQRMRHQTTKNRGDKDGSLKRKFDQMLAETVADGSELNDNVANESNKMFQMELERIGDPDGSLAFTYYLKMVAVLCRRQNESLPLEDSRREVWIQQRAYHLQEIDAWTALNTDFFLTNISKYSEKKPPCIGFLRNLSFATVAATKIGSAKRTKGKSVIQKKPFRRSVGVK